MLASTQLKRRDPFTRNHLIRDGISRAIYEAMRENQAIHLFGEGCAVKVHYDAPDIERDFADRCHTLPIGEDGNLNFAVGTALLGVLPVVDVIAADFLYRCMDSICNTAAKLDFVTSQDHTIVIRAETLLGGPTTGQRPEALFTHIPGLNVVMPSTPRDAYGLMLTALNTPGVTLFLEDRMISDEAHKEGDMRCEARINLGYAWERRNGNATPMLTIVTYGLMRQVAEEALDSSLNIDLIDLRSLYPIDWMEIQGSVHRSKRLLIIEPDVTYGGIGAEIAAHVAEKMPGVQVKRLGAPRQTIPASPALHHKMLPTEEDVIRAIRSF